MKRLFLSLSSIMAVLFITSCATILSGSKQKVTINSEPQDATVYAAKYKKQNIKDGTWRQLDSLPSYKIGNTPLTSKIKRNTRLIFVTKEDYQDTLLYCIVPKMKVRTIEPQTGRQIKKRISPAKYHARTNGLFFANLIFGGYIGFFVDIATGAAYQMDNQMDITLKPN